MRSDFGLANERTALAWQRTALSLVAGAAVVARLAWDPLGYVVLPVLALAGVLGVWVFVESAGRYRHDVGARPRKRARGGRAPLALAVAVVCIGVAELLVLLARAPY